MDEKPPFDPIRAAFWLIAFVVAIYGVVILSFAAGCLLHHEAIITNPEITCDPNNRLMGLLAAALAAALTFASVRRNGKDK
jgi:hypothetical protein